MARHCGIVPEQLRASARAASGALGGLALTYLVFVLTPWGRTLDSLSFHGRSASGWSAFSADLALLDTISTATVLTALGAVVLVAGVRGRWALGLRAAGAVLGAAASAEVLKRLLPGIDHRTGHWRWLTSGSFPSGHAITVTAISLAVLSISSDRWRRLLIGPLLAWTAIATTATVTVGWHRPSDVVGSLFLATAWHRALAAGQPAGRRVRAMLPQIRFGRTAAVWSVVWSVVWWSAACALVLGAALHGILRGRAPGDVAPLAYLMALAGLLAAAGITLARPGQEFLGPNG
jgi:membrane-associated phospholipid phosphatase